MRRTIRRSGGTCSWRLGQPGLDRRRAGHGADHRPELRNEAVAHQLDEPAAMLGQERLQHCLPQVLQGGSVPASSASTRRE